MAVVDRPLMPSFIGAAHLGLDDRLKSSYLFFNFFEFLEQLCRRFGQVGDILGECLDFFAQSFDQLQHQFDLLLAEVIAMLLQSRYQQTVLLAMRLQLLDADSDGTIETPYARANLDAISGQSLQSLPNIYRIAAHVNSEFALANAL